MKFAPTFLLIFFLLQTQVTSATQQTEAIATVVEGIEIPILVITPENGAGPFPVVYHVRGGGWNGGTANEIPPPAVLSLTQYLCDEMGIIYVGLGYRCKNQGGTFQLAIEDLNASIGWFERHASEFNADLSRLGFSGGSAGTPLASFMAQQTEQAKLFIGLFGVYDFTNNSESIFPDEEARLIYGLASESAQREFSTFHNLRKNPPATLLFHGGKDILTHPSQSIRFAEQVKQYGGYSNVVIFPDHNHGYFNPRNPDEYKTTVLASAELFNQYFELNFQGMAGIKDKLDADLARFYPLDTIEPQQVVGQWKSEDETIELGDGGEGTLTDRRGNTKPLSYIIEAGKLIIAEGNVLHTFYLTRDQSAIYKVHPEGRHAGTKVHYNK